MKRTAPTLVLLAAMAVACAPVPTPPPTSTPTPLPPTITPGPSPTPTATPVPTLPAAELQEIVKSVNAQLFSGFKLTANPDGTYAITGSDGRAVGNILLQADGKFAVTKPDASVTILPAETVFMYTPDVIFAGLDVLDTEGGTARAVPFGGWSKNPEREILRITSEMLPQYDRWIRDELEKSGQLNRLFEGTDTAVTWTLFEESWSGLWDVNGDGRKDVYAGLQLTTAVSQHELSFSRIPLRTVAGFVRIMDMPGISVFPAFIMNADGAAEKYSLFPLATDTARIWAPKSPNNHTMLEWLDPAAGGIIRSEIGGKAVRFLVVPAAYLLPAANIDFQGGIVAPEFFRQGINPAEDRAREHILRQGSQNGAFVGSSQHIWPAGVGWVLD